MNEKSQQMAKMRYKNTFIRLTRNLFMMKLAKLHT